MNFLLIWVGFVVGALVVGTLVCWAISEIIELIGGYRDGM